MKLGINIHRVSGQWLKMFSRSKERSSSICKTKSTFAVEEYISTVWRRGLLVLSSVMMLMMMMITVASLRLVSPRYGN